MRRMGGSTIGAAVVVVVSVTMISACGSDNSSDESDPEATPSPTPTIIITPSPSPSPTPIPPSGSIRSLSVGGRQVCWLDDRSLPRCRSVSDDGNVSAVPVPDIVSARVAAGSGVVCGLDLDGLIWCAGPADPWGVSSDYPAGSFDDISVGSDIACALRDGGATCWGRTEILSGGLPARGITYVSVGGSSVCVLDEGDLATCAGQVASPEPQPPANPYDLLDVNGDLNCGVRRSDGGIDCWAARFPARDKEPAGASFIDVAASNAGSCALRRDGSVSCAGTSGPPAFDLSGAGPFSDIDGGSNLICGPIDGGLVECWTTDGSRNLVRVEME